MAHEHGLRFFDCSDCREFTLIASVHSENTCPQCGSANGQVISAAELERRIEDGAAYTIDLSPGARDWRS